MPVYHQSPPPRESYKSSTQWSILAVLLSISLALVENAGAAGTFQGGSFRIRPGEFGYNSKLSTHLNRIPRALAGKQAREKREPRHLPHPQLLLCMLAQERRKGFPRATFGPGDGDVG